MKKGIMILLVLFLTVNAAIFGTMEEHIKIEEEKPRVTLIAPFANEAYWGSMANGVTKAGNDLGISTKCVGFTKMETEKQIQAIESAIYAKVDGIVTAGIGESDEVRALLEKADKEGIRVVLVDSDMEEVQKLCYIGTDNYEAGKMAGKDIIEITGGKGKMAVIVSKMEAQNQKERMEGFQEAIAPYPELKIIKILEGNSDVRILNERISQMLEEEQDLTAVFCAEGYGATSIAQIIKDAEGEYDDVKVVGFGVSELKREDIENGILYSTIYQNSYEMGYRAVKAIKNSMEDKEVLPVDYTEIKSIKKENIDEMEINKGRGAQWHIY
ncbi:MAG: substrate-binding domain-containing protein [Eubacteriales bacterium]|nr:substrate-binding domain-containing protein [Eubacteriales bacterium]